MPKPSDTICYLCGKVGADSKDHVPPKCFLPDSNFMGYQRITIPAHRACNSSASNDEEYLRDLLVQEAVELKLPKADVLSDKVWRAWAKTGWNRYQRFMRNAREVEKRTPSGLFAGKAIGIVPELHRVKTVCRKIARGIIYYDTGAIVDDSECSVVPLSVPDALNEREKNGHEPFWVGMNSNVCHHDMCAETIALRRFYEGVPATAGVASPDNVVIVAHTAIIMWNLFCVCSTTFPLKRVGSNTFQFAINTQDGSWTRKI
jgi:hypothetical protein